MDCFFCSTAVSPKAEEHLVCPACFQIWRTPGAEISVRKVFYPKLPFELCSVLRLQTCLEALVTLLSVHRNRFPCWQRKGSLPSSCDAMLEVTGGCCCWGCLGSAVTGKRLFLPPGEWIKHNLELFFFLNFFFPPVVNLNFVCIFILELRYICQWINIHYFQKRTNKQHKLNVPGVYMDAWCSSTWQCRGGIYGTSCSALGARAVGATTIHSLPTLGWVILCSLGFLTSSLWIGLLTNEFHLNDLQVKLCCSGALPLPSLMVQTNWYWQDYSGALCVFNGAGQYGFLSSNWASFPFSVL